MDEGVSTENSMLGFQSDSLMDELLLEGCWLESSGLFDSSSFSWPTLEDSSGLCSPSKGLLQEERQMSSFTDNLSISQSQGRDYSNSKLGSLDENVNNYAMCQSAKTYEHSRRWWIGPRPSASVMERLIRALGYIKDWSRNKDMLVQIWVPINKGGRRVLSTSNQPFSLHLNSPRLACYRDVSVNYQFAAEEDSGEIAGLPGRVFNGKVPEWTPDVQFFRKDEYLRVGHAEQYDVHGSLAVPIFERVSQNCLGVIEVVLTTQKVNYRPELESVCKALEAVELRSCDISSTPDTKTCDFSFRAALQEIMEVLSTACGTHRLPLAQTWVPCIQQGKRGCRHSNENFIHCVSTVDSACCIADPRIQGFNEACSEHHLLKGQGIVGRAFTTNEPCFTPDITSYAKADYPLSHHARMFELRATVAIRLRSIHTGSTDFVLEFFLPLDCKDPEEHKRMLSSLSIIIQTVCRTLRVVTGKELQDEAALPTDGTSIPPFNRLSEKMPEMEHSQATMASQGWSSQTFRHVEVEEGFSFASDIRTGNAKEVAGKISQFRHPDPDASSKATISFHGSHLTSVDCSLPSANKTGEKKRVKAENTITLEVLRQYFAGSLKDAAKSLGVCPTTLKRICRQHGIKRWPSRKIKKVGHSLQKIQRVIDSVQGASGDIQIQSFYRDFPELASPNMSRAGTGTFSSFKSIDQPEPSETKPEGGTLNPPPVVSTSSPSSCYSQSSSSSQCFSTGKQMNSQTPHVSGQDESVDRLVKRVRSDAELHLSSEGGARFLPRSNSHASFMEHSELENVPPALKEACQNHQEETAQRIKVSYGDENIRFRMQRKWGYEDLMREICRRFGVLITDGFHLKYLDDECEWVLMTCDADLEECIDVCKSSGNQTIKLCLLHDSQQNSGSSSGTSIV